MPIELRNISYVYEKGTPNEKTALSHINITFREGEFVGIIGHTGSGKSTMIQLLNGLIKPSEGSIFLDGEDIFEEPTAEYLAKISGKKHISTRMKREAKAKKMLAVRQRVGLVFQYPEHQLFEMTVAKDIAFGPTNMGLDQEEIDRRVKESAAMVGISPDMLEKSPFELSGGQKRRVAIAGVLAMKPDYLILDEPTAGLDPGGREDILSKIRALQEETGITVLLVSHSMDDVAKYADRIVAMDNGVVCFDGRPEEVFTHVDQLREMGLNVPQVTDLSMKLKERGFALDRTILTMDQMEEWLTKEVIKC